MYATQSQNESIAKIVERECCMKLTLPEIEQQLKEIAMARQGLDEATSMLMDERTFLLNQSKRNPVMVAVVKSLNGAGS